MSDFRFQISDSDFRFQISDFRFQISDFRFQISDFRFQIGNQAATGGRDGQDTYRDRICRTWRFDTDSFESFLADRREPAWLVALRRQAWATFQEMPLPDRKLEEWMRTDIRGFRLEQFGLPSRKRGRG